MAGFEGWWVNGSTGKGYHVAEHGMELMANPERYGLDPKAVEKLVSQFNPGDTDPEGGRGKLLKLAMKNGWVRVRGYQGKYAVQAYGHLASHLPKVLKFMKGAGVSAYSEILVTDLASSYSQRFMDGMSDAHRALKQGRVPDIAPPDEQDRVKIVRKGAKAAPDGIPAGLDDKQARTIMRQRLGQKHHIPDPDPADDKIEESRGRGFARGMKKLLG